MIARRSDRGSPRVRCGGFSRVLRGVVGQRAFCAARPSGTLAQTMCERVDGRLVVCSAARRRMATMLAPVQMAMFPLAPVSRAQEREPEPVDDGARQMPLT